MSTLTTHGSDGPWPYRLGVVFLALAPGGDPVEVDDPFRVRNRDLGTKTDPEIVDLATAVVRHVIVQPRDGIAVRLFRRNRHFDEPYIFEEVYAAAIGIKAIDQAVAISIGERGN